MVPLPETAPWSVSSNELYARGVEKVFNETADKSTPGQDYSYLSTYYPPQWKSPDLKDQIDRFLAMPKPRHAPNETLWVFSFGIWDVWSLAALPAPVGKDLVGPMTRDIFKQIERLVEASTDPDSIAWSDLNAVPDSAAPGDDNEGATDDAAAPSQPETREENADGSEPVVEEEVELPTEYFRILVPRIIDPSMLPGWRDLRPVLPKVHSKAEQMRNSAELTGFWNDEIVNALSDWVKQEDKQPEQAEKKASRDVAIGEEIKRVQEEASSASADLASTVVQPDRAVEIGPVTPIYPVRDGFAYNLADYLLDAMIERQMRNARLKDGVGRGDRPVEEGYRDVTNACVQQVNTVAVSISVESGITLDIPNRNIGKDVQVPTVPTPHVSRREDNSNGVDGDAGSTSQTSSLVKFCDSPSDHLFYTPFALSQRAIVAIASQSAELIRRSDTIRAKLQGKANQ